MKSGMARKKREFTPENGNVDTYEMSMEKKKVDHAWRAAYQFRCESQDINEFGKVDYKGALQRKQIPKIRHYYEVSGWVQVSL